MDYTKINEITVKTQKDLNDIPEDFAGQIYIEFGTWDNRAAVSKRYKCSVEALGNSSVIALGNSSVIALGNSSVEAWGNSSVEAWGNSLVEALGNSSVEARGNSSVIARGNSSVEARDNSSVEARDNSSVVARGKSSVIAWDNSSVEARGDSSVIARGNSSVEAWDDSSVEASDNAQIVDRLDNGRIQVAGNARIVYMPKTIDEYCSFYGIMHTEKKGTFFKAVHKRGDRYFSDYSFAPKLEYVIGEKATANGLCTDTAIDCGCGIHIAHLNWALDYGNNWGDLAILEVEAELDKIIVPVNGCGKVRCAEVKVLREVPLEECGVYGKFLIKKNSSLKEENHDE